MTDGERTYASLLDFGVEPALAREASKRYAANVEAAADWCFGAGLDVGASISSRDLSSPALREPFFDSEPALPPAAPHTH